MTKNKEMLYHTYYAAKLDELDLDELKKIFYNFNPEDVYPNIMTTIQDQKNMEESEVKNIYLDISIEDIYNKLINKEFTEENNYGLEKSDIRIGYLLGKKIFEGIVISDFYIPKQTSHSINYPKIKEEDYFRAMIEIRRNERNLLGIVQKRIVGLAIYRPDSLLFEDYQFKEDRDNLKRICENAGLIINRDRNYKLIYNDEQRENERVLKLVNVKNPAKSSSYPSLSEYVSNIIYLVKSQVNKKFVGQL